MRELNGATGCAVNFERGMRESWEEKEAWAVIACHTSHECCTFVFEKAAGLLPEYLPDGRDVR